MSSAIVKKTPPLPLSAVAKQYKIAVHGLKIDCLIGIHEHEQHTPQTLIFDINAEATLPENLEYDRYSDITCYDFLATTIRHICANRQYHLLETLGWHIAQKCFEHRCIQNISITIKKPKAIKQADAGAISLTFERS